MRKYIFGFKLYFLNVLQYRFNTFIQLVVSTLSLLITILFWFLIYERDTTRVLNGFTLSDMITYFVITRVFHAMILRDSGFIFSGMIKNGTLGPMLLKPQKISVLVYCQNLASSINVLIPQIALLLILIPFMHQFMVWDLRLVNTIYIFLFLIVGSISSHLLWSIFGYMAFWIEEANAVMWSFAVMLDMATGLIIPLDFFPEWSIKVLEILPFSSWSYIPAKIYLNFYSIEKELFLLGIHITWIFILICVNSLLWKKGLAKYSSVGG